MCISVVEGCLSAVREAICEQTLLSSVKVDHNENECITNSYKTFTTAAGLKVDSVHHPLDFE